LAETGIPAAAAERLILIVNYIIKNCKIRMSGVVETECGTQNANVSHEHGPQK
jgi:hypothetical protein